MSLRVVSSVLLAALACRGQEPVPAPTPTPEGEPASAPPAATELERRVDRLFRGAARPGVPGAVVLVAQGDRVLLRKAYGLADVERQVPLTVDSRFDLGSTSKQFTAACVLLLEQDGRLALADPVRRHVGELQDCCAPVTLRHLMLHTSGIPDYIGLLLTAGRQLEDRTTMADALEQLALVTALEFPCGTDWAYSNSNYLLLSLVVERVAGRSLAAFAEERLFAPLGMTRTHVHTDCTRLVPQRALSYTRDARDGWRWCFSNWEQTGDGAVFSTVDDLWTWARNFTAPQAGLDALVAAMAAPGPLDDGRPIDYGTGLVHGELDGLRSVRHGGAWAAYRAELLRLPERDLTVVCLCNRDDLEPSERAAAIARIALASANPRGTERSPR